MPHIKTAVISLPDQPPNGLSHLARYLNNWSNGKDRNKYFKMLGSSEGKTYIIYRDKLHEYHPITHHKHTQKYHS